MIFIVMYSEKYSNNINYEKDSESYEDYYIDFWCEKKGKGACKQIIISS